MTLLEVARRGYEGVFMRLCSRDRHDAARFGRRIPARSGALDLRKNGDVACWRTIKSGTGVCAIR